MPSPNAPQPHSYRAAWIACWDEMDRCNFTDIDREVVLARFLYREENRLLVHGKGQFDDPLSWMQAIEKARTDEVAHGVELTEKHGYPDTAGMAPQEAHFARLAFLMTKYPQADWDLLMEGQEEAMTRKPAERVVPEVTVQGIENTKKRFLALRSQRAELMASGENSDLLASVITAMARNRTTLERRGVSIAELIEGGSTSATTASHANGANEKTVDKPTAELPAKVEARGSDDAPQVPKANPITPDEPGATMTAREAASVVGIAYTTMLSELSSGRFPFANTVGKQWRISRKGLYDWLEGHRSDVEALKVSQDATPKPRGKQGQRPVYVRPDGKPLSF